MAEKQQIHFKQNFQFPAPNGILRSSSVIVIAANAKEATKLAEERIKLNHQVYKLGSIIQWI